MSRRNGKPRLKRFTVIGVDHDYKPRTENTWLMRVLAPTPLYAALKAEEEGQKGSDGFQAIYVLNGWPSERRNNRSIYEDAKVEFPEETEVQPLRVSLEGRDRTPAQSDP